MPRVALPPGKTDEDYVLGAAARNRRAVRLRLRLRHRTRATGSSASCSSPSPAELESIYDDIAEFTRQFLARGEAS